MSAQGMCIHTTPELTTDGWKSGNERRYGGAINTELGCPAGNASAGKYAVTQTADACEEEVQW